MIETLKIKSTILRNERDLYVMLPPGYEEETVTYPVFYMHDGQNIFSTHGNWFKKWNIDYVLQDLYARQAIEKIIVVGITHLNTREYEFTPTFDALINNGGGADKYIRFMVEEVKPLIQSTYRARTDRASQAVGGSSLGGIITLYTAIARSDEFGKFAVVSPSMWWDFGVMLEKARSWTPRMGTLKLWIDIGAHEGPGSALIDDILKEIYNPVNFCRVLCNILMGKGFKLKKSLMYIEDPDGIHDEVTWGRRFYDICRYFFPLGSADESSTHHRKTKQGSSN
jgi:predicted alpha/beta superfamily hydrolase